MTVIGFHCSHEQISPAQLLERRPAGRAGRLHRGHVLGPLQPVERNARASPASPGPSSAPRWPRRNLPFGVVNAPGQRYHPAIIAQAIATLAQMFPGRFWAALGSGEASNERVTGEAWPRKEIRDQRLVECVDVIRRLLAGEEVSHEGLVHVNRARLWTLPETVPDLVGPAVTPETAARHAAWADGLVTVNQSKETLQKVLDAYREAGGRGPARLQIHLSWAPTEEEALAIAHDQWRSNVFDPPVVLGRRDRRGLRRHQRERHPRAGRQSVRVSQRFRPARRVAAGVRRARVGRAVPALRRAAAGRASSTHSASTCCPSFPRPRPSGRRSHEAQRHGRPVVEERRLLLRGRRNLLRLRTATAAATSAA